eukprot:2993021-Prymnesium_polylepis.1
MLAYTTIVVRFSADGAALIERLEDTKSENTAGGPQANRVGPATGEPSGGGHHTFPLPPGLLVSTEQVGGVRK